LYPRIWGSVSDLKGFFVSVIELGFTMCGQRIPWRQVLQSTQASPCALNRFGTVAASAHGGLAPTNYLTGRRCGFHFSALL
jgi:hypothetical protein